MPSQPLDNATVTGQYLEHECPSYAKRSLGLQAKSASGFRYRWLSGGQTGDESKDDKLSVLDILATDEHGRMLNIEQQ